jgi:hypothetical protein
MGTIGATAFGEMLGHPALEDGTVIIETPGERHVDDISLLRSLLPPAI